MPIHGIVDAPNVFLGVKGHKKTPGVFSDEKVRKERGRDDDGDEKGKVVYTLRAIVVFLDPVVGVIYIPAIRLGEDTIVTRKGRPPEVQFNGGKVEVASFPRSIAIVEDSIVVGDSLGLDRKRERRIGIRKKKGSAGRVSATEMTPRVKDRNFMRSAPGASVLDMRREVLNMKCDQGEPEDLFEEGLLGCDAIDPCDV